MKEIRQLFWMFSPLQRAIMIATLLIMGVIIAISATDHRNLQPLPQVSEDATTPIAPVVPVPDPALTPAAERSEGLQSDQNNAPATPAPSVQAATDKKEDAPARGLVEEAREQVKDESVLDRAVESAKKHLPL